jgi:hypothetical protein
MEKISTKWNQCIRHQTPVSLQLGPSARGWLERLMTFYQVFCMPDPVHLSQAPLSSKNLFASLSVNV